MKTTLLLLAIAALSGCATGEVLKYSGPSQFTGAGGVIKTVDGIDIYLAGEPRGTYQVVSILSGSYYRGGNVLMSMASEQSALNKMVRAAKEANADAIVILSRNHEVLGSSHGGMARATVQGNQISGTYAGRSVVHGSQSGTAAVVKYLNVTK